MERERCREALSSAAVCDCPWCEIDRLPGLRNVLSEFQTGHEIAVGIEKRLNEVEANLPGLQREAEEEG